MQEYVDVTVRFKVSVDRGGKRACLRLARELLDRDFGRTGADSVVGCYFVKRRGVVRAAIAVVEAHETAKRCLP